MGFPVGAQTTVLTVNVGLANGAAERETIRLTPSPPQIVSTTLNHIVEGDPVALTPDRGTGTGALRVLNTDASGYNPTGWTYKVERGDRPAYYVEIPVSLGPSVDLADLTPVSADPGVYDQLIRADSLGDAATKNVGTGAGDVAAGDTLAQAKDYADTHGGLPGTQVTGTGALGLALAGSGNATAAFIGASGVGDWIFNVRAYGAAGDGQVVTDGAMTVGSAVLACTTSHRFTSADINKAIMVKGAASTPTTTLVTTIAGFTDSGHVILGTTAATSISGALVMWATDDTAAVQAAINAAVSHAQTYNGVARVFIPGAPGFYGIAGPLVTGGTTKGNSQLTLPIIATAGRKVVLTIEGVANGSGVQHWEQAVPQVSGSVLVSFGVFASSSAQTTSIDGGGNPCVIGGPSQPGGYGVSPGIFSNMLVTLKNLSILTTYSLHGLTYTAGDLSGVANGHLENLAYGVTGTVVGNDFSSPNQFANGLSVGFLMPAAGNNDNCIVRNITCHGGYTYAFFATEHCVIDTMRLLYCWSALCPVGTYFNSVGATHAIKAQQLSIEACTNVVYVIGAGSGGVGPIVDIDQLDTESSTPTFDGNSTGAMASALGTIKLTGLFTPSGVTVAKPTGLRISNGQVARASVVKTGDYTVSAVDENVLVDASSAAVTVTLIDARYTPNQYTVIKTDSSAHAVTVAAQSGQTVNGAASVAVTAQNGSLTLFSAYNGVAYGWHSK